MTKHREICQELSKRPTRRPRTRRGGLLVQLTRFNKSRIDELPNSHARAVSLGRNNYRRKSQRSAGRSERHLAPRATSPAKPKRKTSTINTTPRVPFWASAGPRDAREVHPRKTSGTDLIGRLPARAPWRRRVRRRRRATRFIRRYRCRRRREPALAFAIRGETLAGAHRASIFFRLRYVLKSRGGSSGACAS